jgi:hypothetical protein
MLPLAGSIAFGNDVSYTRLSGLLSEDAEMHETRLSENFDFDAYYKKYYRKAIPLFAIDSRDRLRIFSAEHELKPGPGWTLLSLIEQEVETGADERTDTPAADDDAASPQPAS